ncbi:MAG: FHA domain-containing protein [Caldilineae bacterium]|nr:MAG: FHA domain-containing protein [Caldilineae bacterium]
MLHPDDYQSIHRQADVSAEVEAIQRYLQALMAETGSRPSGALAVSIEPETTVAPGNIRVTADHLLPSPADTPPKTGDTRRMPAAIAPPADRWQLRLPAGRVRLGMPVVRLGQSEHNDIPIAGESVSPYHAQLRWRKGVYYAQNLSRTAPLLLNGKAVTGAVPLKAGDTLQLGEVTLQVEIADDA